MSKFHVKGDENLCVTSNYFSVNDSCQPGAGQSTLAAKHLHLQPQDFQGELFVDENILRTIRISSTPFTLWSFQKLTVKIILLTEKYYSLH